MSFVASGDRVGCIAGLCRPRDADWHRAAEHALFRALLVPDRDIRSDGGRRIELVGRVDFELNLDP